MANKNHEKSIPILILDILNKYSGESSPIKQVEIQEFLKRDYNEDVDRKTVKRHLDALKNTYDNKKVVQASGKLGWYSNPDFSKSESRLLSDAVVFSNNMKQNQKKGLLEKIKKFSDKDFLYDIDSKHIKLQYTTNAEFIKNIGILSEAISKKKKVSFKYLSYGIKGQKIVRTKSKHELNYKLSPYHLVLHGGRYYLICKYNIKPNISNYRVDRMIDLQIDKEKAEPISKTIEYRHNRFDINQYLIEHPYMMAGPLVHAVFTIKLGYLNDLYDWFGKKVKITHYDDHGAEIYDDPKDYVRNLKIKVEANVNKLAMMFWALQYNTNVEILGPADFREEMRKLIAKLSRTYERPIQID